MASISVILSRSRSFLRTMPQHCRSFAAASDAGAVIKLTFVDEEGNRATVPARCGQTLLDAAVMHKIDIEHPCDGGGGPIRAQRTEDWNEDTFGDGPGCYACHVKIPSKYHHLISEDEPEVQTAMEDMWGSEKSKTSRLACQITLDKKHDGMVIFVPDPPLTDMCI